MNMDIGSVSMDGVEYPIETTTVEENGIFDTSFLCIYPDGSKKSLQVRYSSGTEQDLLDDHKISLRMELESMVLWEIKKELFQEINGIKITNLWERFCDVSLKPSELQANMEADLVFRKFVEEFYPDYSIGN
jgi:hypothetical protein